MKRNFLALTRVATYRRTIYASLERIWENVLDWEHLPWLHRSAFAAVEVQGQTPEGWRAWVTLAPAHKGRKALIEIETDTANLRYWSRTLAGQGMGSEVLTSLIPLEANLTDVAVEFYMADVPLEKVTAAGEAYLRFYTRLWDEDERMMRRRQDLLERGWQDRGKKRDRVPLFRQVSRE
ncbi:MAG: hypothetical protein AB7G75_24465 [Candidatus Binatia bacterium]